MLGCRVSGGGEAKLMVLRSRREIACQARKYTTWAKERLAAVVPQSGFVTHQCHDVPGSARLLGITRSGRVTCPANGH